MYSADVGDIRRGQGTDDDVVVGRKGHRKTTPPQDVTYQLIILCITMSIYPKGTEC